LNLFLKSQKSKIDFSPFVEDWKDDYCTEKEVTGVLQLLSNYAKKLKNLQSPNQVFVCLLAQIAKLYFEINLLFNALLSKKEHYCVFSNFLDDILKQQNGLLAPVAKYRNTKTTKRKRKKPKISTRKQKSLVLKLIAFLAGYNRHNKKIMSNDEFERLKFYIFALIDTGKIPEDIQPIAKTGITNEYLRYTFYLIHVELYTSRPIRPEWIDLLHAIFTQFNEVEKETTRKKFSSIPTFYTTDLRFLIS